MDSYLSAEPAYSSNLSAENDNNDDNSWLVFNNSSATGESNTMLQSAVTAATTALFERYEENAIKVNGSEDGYAIEEEDLKKILREHDIDPSVFTSVMAALPETSFPGGNLGVEMQEEDDASYDSTLPTSYPGFFSSDGEQIGANPFDFAFVPQSKPAGPQPQPQPAKRIRRRQTPASTGRRYNYRSQQSIEVYEEEHEGDEVFEDEQQQQQQQQQSRPRRGERHEQEERERLMMMMMMNDVAMMDDEGPTPQHPLSSTVDSKDQEISDLSNSDAVVKQPRDRKSQQSEQMTRRTPIVVKFDPIATTATTTTTTTTKTNSSSAKSPRSLIHVPYESAPKATISKLKQYYDQQTQPHESSSQSTPHYDNLIKRHCIPVPNKRKSSSFHDAKTKSRTASDSTRMGEELRKCLEVSEEAAHKASSSKTKSKKSASAHSKGTKIPQPVVRKSDNQMSRLSCGSKPSRTGNLTKSLSLSSKQVEQHSNQLNADLNDQAIGPGRISSGSARLLHSANLVVSESISNGVTTHDDDEDIPPPEHHTFAFTPVSDINAEFSPPGGPPLAPSISAVNACARRDLHRSSTVSIISAFSPGRIPDHLFYPPPHPPPPPPQILTRPPPPRLVTPVINTINPSPRRRQAGLSLLNFFSSPSPPGPSFAQLVQPVSAAAAAFSARFLEPQRLMPPNRPLRFAQQPTLTDCSLRSILSALAPGPIPSSLFRPPQPQIRRSPSASRSNATVGGSGAHQMALAKLPPRPPSTLFQSRLVNQSIDDIQTPEASFTSILSALAPGPIPDQFAKTKSSSASRFKRSQSAGVFLNGHSSNPSMAFLPPPPGPPPPPPPPPLPPPPPVPAPPPGGPQKSRSSRTVTSSSLGSVFSKLAPGPIPDSLFQSRTPRYPTPPSAAPSPRNAFFTKVVSSLKGIPLNAPLHCYEQALEAASSKLVRCSTVPYKCSLVRRELNPSVKYVRPVRICSTPYEVAATIFENEGGVECGQVCAPLPNSRSRLVLNSGSKKENLPIADVPKTQHANLKLPNNMGHISIVIENLKI